MASVTRAVPRIAATMALTALVPLFAQAQEMSDWRLELHQQLAAAQTSREDAQEMAREAAEAAREATEHLDELIADAVESATASIAGRHTKEIVKNAPFSADVVYETRQTLADGNRIVRKSQSSFARDSMGRTRQQRGAKTVIIDDVVAGRTYVLHPDGKTAVRLPQLGADLTGADLASAPFPPRAPAPPGTLAPPAPAARIASTGEVDVRPGRVVVQHKAGSSGEDVRVEVIRVAPDAVMNLTPPTPPGTPLPPLTLNGHPLAISMPHGRPVTESLGTREIEGLRAEGTRTSYTVPAGAIGNEKPIVTTAERWFSPELQVVVLTTTNDPRAGETIYRLANVKRGEPPAELFRVPADARVRGEGKNPR